MWYNTIKIEISLNFDGIDARLSAISKERRSPRAMARKYFGIRGDRMNERIRQLRTMQGMTQAELAEKLGVANMHVTLADERHYACATVIIES